MALGGGAMGTHVMRTLVNGGLSLHAFPLGRGDKGQSENSTFYEMGMGGELHPTLGQLWERLSGGADRVGAWRKILSAQNMGGHLEPPR